MFLDLVPSDDPILYKEVPKFEFDGSVNPWTLAENLIETMRMNKGIGLSANQCGLPYRVFVMEGEPAFAMFNPRIVDSSDNTEILLDEGCLSFKNLFIKIKRPRLVKVRFQDPNGETHTMKLDGISARVVLHELDHLNGVDFRKRANPYHLEKAKKLKKKIDKGQLQVSYKALQSYGETLEQERESV